MHWLNAIQEEFDSQIRNGTWCKTMLPAGQKAIGLKWILKLKRLPDGLLDKYKARVVALGYNQREGVDYDLLFAPVAKKTTLIYFLHTVAARDLECHVLDFTTAFLNGSLEEEIYVEQPPLFHDGTNQVLRLNKALYGLKQAPRQWWKELTTTLIRLGFEVCIVDVALGRVQLPEGTLWVLFYVDDVLIAAKSLRAVCKIKQQLLDIYAGTDKGEVLHYLGLTIRRNRPRRLLYLDQSSYAGKILEDTYMTQARPKYTPLPTKAHEADLGAPLSEFEAQKYRKTVGALMYMSTMTRPDLAHASGFLARHLSQPFEVHADLLQYTLAYLSKTRDHVLTLGDQAEGKVQGWVDSDYGSERGRRSIYGYLFKMQGSLISWKSKRHGILSTSSTEAEFAGAAQAVREALHLLWLMEFMTGDAPCVPIYIDNRSALDIILNPVIEDNRKCIDVVLNHVRERTAAKLVSFQWIPSGENSADMLTKPLPRPLFEKHRLALGLSRPSQ
jgi:hypothetical protein